MGRKYSGRRPQDEPVYTRPVQLDFEKRRMFIPIMAGSPTPHPSIGMKQHGNEWHNPDFASLDIDSWVVEAVKKIRVCNSAPGLPAEGDIYIDSVADAMYVAVG